MRINTLLGTARLGAILLTAHALALGSAAADQVIPDDLIVQGSTCSGLDCVNNEAFGFGTLRLKENNTRIDFIDTSTSAGFATRDWRLLANDSPGAGAARFAIIDLGDDASAGVGDVGTPILSLSAGAPENSLFVSGAGNVGFGTAAPALDLSLMTTDTPAIRMEQTAAGGFTPQTWDVAGNEANFFVRDVTGGSRLPFRIRPGAPTSSVDIAATGNVGIGTATPQVKLHVFGGARLRLENATDIRFDLFTDASGRLRFIAQDGNIPMVLTSANVGIGTTAPGAQLHTTGSVRFQGLPGCAAGIATNANGVLSCISSSRRFKNVAGDLEPDVALANIMALRPQVGTYIETPNVPEHWLIAEEVAEVDPAFVGLTDGVPHTVKTQNVVADLIAVVQQQQARIEALETELARIAR